MIKAKVLGSGDSAGIPALGCQCLTCKSLGVRKLRPSIAVFTGQNWFTIDCGPDFKEQTLTYDFSNFVGVCFTHAHLDHILGVPELRDVARKQNRRLTVYLTKETHEMLLKRFPDRISLNSLNDDVEKLACVLINPFEDFIVGSVTITPVLLRHGAQKTTGFRIGDFAYCTDANFIPEETLDRLVNLKNLILDGGWNKNSKDHFGIKDAVLVGEKLRVKNLYLTHIGHEFDFESFARIAPSWVSILEDNQEIEIDLAR